MAEDPGAKAVADKSTGLWGLLAANTAMIGAGLYLAGWIYLYSYLRSFNVDIGLLDVGWHEILVHSAVIARAVVRGLFGWPAWPITLIAIPALLIYLDRHNWLDFSVRQMLGNSLSLYYAPLVAALLSVAWLFSFAHATGIDKARNTRKDGTSFVTLRLKDKPECKASEAEPLAIWNRNRKLKLLISTSKWYVLFVLSQPSPGVTDHDATATVLVPIECIRTIEALVRQSV